MRHYNPLYSYRVGINLITVVPISYINRYIGCELPEPPEPDPLPDPPEPEPLPDPPEPEPLPDPPEPEPLPEPPEPEPLPEPPDPEPLPEPPDPDPDPDEIYFPGICCLGFTEDEVVSHKGQGWLKITSDTLEAWEIVSVEHLRQSLLASINQVRACVAFNLHKSNQWYDLVHEFVIKTNGVVYQ